MTDSKALVDKLWNYCNVLRDDGLSYGDYVEQLTGALKDELIELARHLAPLVSADVLSCWCPLDAPCHGDTLCDLVGRLRSGDLVPGLVATPNVCGGALRIECTDWSVVMVADEITRFGEYDDWTSEEAVYALAADLEVDPDLVEVAARVLSLIHI